MCTLYLFHYQVEENHVINRLLPGKMEIWKRKRNKKEEKRAKARENTLKEWVNHDSHMHVHVHGDPL